MWVLEPEAVSTLLVGSDQKNIRTLGHCLLLYLNILDRVLRLRRRCLGYLTGIPWNTRAADSALILCGPASYNTVYARALGSHAVLGEIAVAVVVY
jgi:hypothetical protein